MKHRILVPLMAGLSLCTGNAYTAPASLHAHEHGAVKVGIAIEKNVAMITIDTPAESLIGFEYKPKTKEEMATYDKAEKLWKTMFDLVAFDPKSGCHVEESAFAQKFDEPENSKDRAVHTKQAPKEEGIHSDIEASAKISCSAAIEGTSIKVAFKKYFKNIKKLTVDVVAGKTFTRDVINPVETIAL